MKSFKFMTVVFVCVWFILVGVTVPGFGQEQQETQSRQETQGEQETQSEPETQPEQDETVETTEPVEKESKKSAGLRQLLDIGIRNAVKLVGIEDGFYKNELIKILLPEKLKKVDKILRQFGGKKLSDSLVKKMNRAAEKASALALDIFVDAVKKIKFKDVVALLSGKEHAATEFLRATTYDTLKEKFSPIIQTTMEEIGALKTYNSYAAKYKNNPFIKELGLDIDIVDYVTEKSIDGLFTMVAKEEEKIRTDPAARVTSLLQTVFGK